MPTVHRMKITLDGVKPPIWRRIEARSDTTLGELSDLLEAAMGWMGGHLHAFDIGGTTYERSDPDEGLGPRALDEDAHRLDQVLSAAGEAFRWDYDFGDGWRHRVEVEAIEPADPAITYPRCIGGRRACPPEDCGGPYGFAELLEAIGDEEHPRHEELMDWIPPQYDPADFDKDETTEDMQTPRIFDDDWL